MMEGELRTTAVDRAYRDHRDDVYRVAYAILRDNEEAVDATQETFARAFERWDQYDPDRPLRAWLHGIVTHEALDRLRRRQVHRLALPNLTHLALGARSQAEPDNPERIVSRRQVIDQALSGLKPAARAALVLRHYYGYSYAEIATQLRSTPGTVGSLLSRAHAILRADIVSAAGSEAPSTDRPRRAAR
ncbi:MAG TPA: sigma-70 family RNA polymerase sigma factor [Candidatus Saccharimonadales bacterium]|nr:sigma-70 family RNA polymerase sigma factor [Candidatus Saccharimonadales bacterium]